MVLDETDIVKILKKLIISLDIVLKDVDSFETIQFLENFQTTFLSLITNSRIIGIGEILKPLKNIEKQIKKLKSHYKVLAFKTYENCVEATLSNLEIVTKKNAYDFVKLIIMETKNFQYLEQVISIYPHYINARNMDGKSLIVDLLNEFLVKLNQNDPDIEYLNSVIFLFLSSRRLHLDNCETEQMVKSLEKYKNSNNFADSPKKTAYLDSILNLITKNKNSQELTDTIKKKYEITHSFDINVQNELESLISENYIISIDKAGSNSLDDAFSVIKTDFGYHISIYIADVPSFVKFNGSIDLEAYRRAQSIYLSDQRFMLYPSEISNVILSLNRNGPKKVMKFEWDLYKDGGIDKFKISLDTIKIDRNFGTSEVETILKEGGKNRLETQALNNVFEVASILKNGNDKKYLFRDIIALQRELPTENSLSGFIVEEFMFLLAVSITEMMHAKDLPFIRRAHSVLLTSDSKQMLEKVKEIVINNYEEEYLKIVKQLALIYPKAFYTTENLPHEGLGVKHYGTISSPLRKYVDSTNQRIIHELVLSEPTLSQLNFWTFKALEIANYTNERLKENESFQKEYEHMKRLGKT